MSYEILPILPAERVLFLGENGCGKSTLARRCLDVQPRYVILDTKRDFPALPDERLITDPKDRRFREARSKRLHYRPDWKYLDPGWTSHVLEQCAERALRYGKEEPFICYIDEGLDQARRGDTGILAQLQITGRSIGVGLWLASQRPRHIPVEIRSEAHRWYVFHLGFEEDELEVMRYTKRRLSLADIEAATQNYAFIEIRRDPDQAGNKLISRFPPVRFDPSVYKVGGR